MTLQPHHLPLRELVDREDVPSLTRLLDEGLDPNGEVTPGGWGITMLHHAARLGRVAVVKLLLERKANPNLGTHGGHGDVLGMTPLHEALANEIDPSACREVIDLLLSGGADVNATCSLARSRGWRRTALDYALRRGSLERVHQLQQSGGVPAVMIGAFRTAAEARFLSGRRVGQRRRESDWAGVVQHVAGDPHDLAADVVVSFGLSADVLDDATTAWGEPSDGVGRRSVHVRLPERLSTDPSGWEVVARGLEQALRLADEDWRRSVAIDLTDRVMSRWWKGDGPDRIERILEGLLPQMTTVDVVTVCRSSQAWPARS